MAKVRSIRKKMPTALMAELAGIAVRLLHTLDDKKALEEKEADAKARIKELAREYDLPLDEGTSQYLNVPDLGKALRVSRSEPKLKVDPQAFLERLGPERFLEVCTVTGVDIDLKVWDRLVELELVKEKDLLDCAVGLDDEPTISVGFAALRKEETDGRRASRGGRG